MPDQVPAFGQLVPEVVDPGVRDSEEHYLGSSGSGREGCAVDSFRWGSEIVVDVVRETERGDQGSWEDHRLERSDDQYAGSWVVLQLARTDASERETGVVHSWVS